VLFLEGDGGVLIEDLAQRMDEASSRLEFETAAIHRDRIAALRTILASQHVSGFEGNIDIIAVSVREHAACIEVIFIRNGQQIGNQSFFPRMPEPSSPTELLAAFVGQYYLEHSPPREIIMSHPLAESDATLLEAMLSSQAGSSVRLTAKVRGDRLRKLEMAQLNADQSLLTHLASQQTMQQRTACMVEALHLSHPPQRIECFDISHTQGELTVASCVVFGPQGAIKSDYRRFNITGITPGDDYAAMHQALERRYQRILQDEIPAPDLLLIDGGRGQIAAAIKALQAIGADPEALGIQIIGVAKGPDRKPGLEMLFAVGRKDPIILPAHSPALLLIQQVRDEAHRFAITGHRQRRAKARQASSLEELAGVGPKRRQQLLRQFGGLREISRADVDALASVEGISRQLAQRIYDFFHDQGR
jgi:excinuclease ABC subunit C